MMRPPSVPRACLPSPTALLLMLLLSAAGSGPVFATPGADRGLASAEDGAVDTALDGTAADAPPDTASDRPAAALDAAALDATLAPSADTADASAAPPVTAPVVSEGDAVNDPWQPFNRRMHSFNARFDQSIAKPVAKAYVRALPRPARAGVSNFFRNLRQPVVIVNSLLQGDGTRAWQSLGRFLLNSTVGIGGVFDPASHEGFPEAREDFGQTLGRWGWRQSRYLELPLLGPSTLRDSIGRIADTPLDPLGRVSDDALRVGLSGLGFVNLRAQLLPTDALRDGAADDYTLLRDAWLQQRSYQIEKDRHPGTSVLPDYLQSLPAEDAPATP